MRRVLITGANRGIGLELVRQCLANGDYVFAGCRYPKRARDLQLLTDSYPDQLTSLKIDITDEGTIDESKAKVQAQVDGLDILFNNAGVYVGGETIEDVCAEDLMFTVRVNAVGPLLVAQRFLSLLKNGKTPRIINISSEAGSISR